MSPTEIVIASVFGMLIFTSFVIIAFIIVVFSVSDVINDSRRRKEREKREQTD